MKKLGVMTKKLLKGKLTAFCRQGTDVFLYVRTKENPCPLDVWMSCNYDIHVLSLKVILTSPLC